MPARVLGALAATWQSSYLNLLASKDATRNIVMDIPFSSRRYKDIEAAGGAEEEEEGSRYDEYHLLDLTFNVRFAGVQASGETPDLFDVWVSQKDRVRDLKDRIRQLRPNLGRRSLRLISHGRVLADSIVLVPYIHSLVQHHNDASFHQHDQSSIVTASTLGANVTNVQKWFGNQLGVVTEDIDGQTSQEDLKGKSKAADVKGKGKGKQKERAPTIIWLHCSVGENETREDEKEKLREAGESSEFIEPKTGLDRLTDAGLSQEEVDNLRRRFWESRNQQDDDAHARALEDQWLEGAPTEDESERRVHITFLFGATMGFFFPWLAFFFGQPLFPRPWQVAICVGAFMNWIMGRFL